MIFRIISLFLLLIITFPIGKAKSHSQDPRLRWLPSMRILRWLLIARISQLVEISYFHLDADFTGWIRVINNVAVSLLVLDLVPLLLLLVPLLLLLVPSLFVGRIR